VAEHVVHLAGDLLPGPQLGLLGEQPRFDLGPLRPIAQGLDQAAARLDDQAPRDGTALDGYELYANLTLAAVGAALVVATDRSRA
jgi:hypothetical protein